MKCSPDPVVHYRMISHVAVFLIKLLYLRAVVLPRKIDTDSYYTTLISYSCVTPILVMYWLFMAFLIKSPNILNCLFDNPPKMKTALQ